MEVQHSGDTAAGEWKAGWRLLLPATLGTGLISIIIYSIGVFIAPLEAEFGWSRTLITSALTITSLITAAGAIPVGLLVDRFGPRRIAIPGLIVYCSSLVLVGTTTSAALHWIGLWVLVGICASFVLPMVWTTPVAGRFSKSRGMALAIALCGPGVAAIYSPVLSTFVSDTFGWRMGFAAFGLVIAAVMLPLTFAFFFNEAGDRLGSVRKRGSEAQPAGLPKESAQASADKKKDFRADLLSGQFIRLALASGLIMTSVTSILTHFVPIIADSGIDRITAASIAGAIGVAGIAGRLVTGYFLDRADASLVGTVAFLLPLVSCMILLNLDGSIIAATIAAICAGAAVGAELDVAAYLTTRLFGVKNYGGLFGVIVGLMNLGIAVGPVIAAMIYDNSGNYDAAIYAVTAGSVLAAAMVFSTRWGPRKPLAVGH